jgi:ABC-type multidrug transport system fused ATPase/permease subunit
MSFIVELGVPASVGAVSELLKEWVTLRQTKKEEELKTPEWKALEQAYIDHLLWRFSYPRKIFGQQTLANWIITFVVLALVVSGLVFSFLQLRYAITLGDLSSLRSSVEIETAGKVSISSSVVGAITLVISLAFFALYLKYVFQIKHPVPPHVSFTETDASAVLAKLRSESKNVEDDGDVKITALRQG